LLVSGILFYWAEGSRLSDNGKIEFTNTDPKIIKIMMSFFRKALKVPNNKFRIMVRIGSEENVEKAKTYWSKITEVPDKSFHVPEILNLSSNSKSLEKHPYGMCRVCVYDSTLFRKTIALIDEFSRKFKDLPL
jgi:hypothetical protein